LAEYLSEKERHGQAKPQTCASHRAVLLRFFAGHLDQNIVHITPQRAEALYQRAVTARNERGVSPAVATHRLYLDLAKAFFKWALRAGHVARNPFQDVRPVGRPNTGKPQLRLDEARRYLAAALRLFDEQNDRLALAAVVPLYLGLRAGEVLTRRVRDVDGEASVLWIDKGKSHNARRHLSIKAQPLRERLARLVAGRPPEEAVFCVNSGGQPPGATAFRRAVHRVCAAADVPIVCPHSLRGLWATLSIESGAAESAVAAALGHGAFDMTAKHYAKPEALLGVRSARVLELLGQPGNEHLDALAAEELAAKLPPGILAKLVALVDSQPPPESTRPVAKKRKPVSA
jgi:integrase